MALRGTGWRAWRSSHSFQWNRASALLRGRGCSTTVADQSAGAAEATTEPSKSNASGEEIEGKGEMRRMRPRKTKEESKAERESELVRLLQSIGSTPQDSTRILREWIKQGNHLKFKNFSEIAKTLAEHPMSACKKEAVKFMKSARRDNIIKARTPGLVLELDTLLHEFGAAPVERFYSRLRPELKTEELTVAFLTKMSKAHPRNALKFVDGLKPTTPELHNAIIFVYWNLKMHDEMLAAYAALKNNDQLLPKLETYLLMLKCKERVGGLEGIEEETEAFVRKIRIKKASVFKLDHLMEVFAYLGDAEKVEEIYGIVKSPRPPLRPLRDSFRVAARSFGRLGMVNRAEEVVEDSKEFCKQSYRQGNLIDVYAEAGMLDKAEEVLEKINKEKLTFAPFDALIRGYLANDEREKALDRFKKGCAVRSVVPSYETVAALLPVFEELKFSRSAEGLMLNYLTHAAGDLRLYKSFLKVHIACDSEANSKILSKFEIEQDSEAKELLGRVKIRAVETKKQKTKENTNSASSTTEA